MPDPNKGRGGGDTAVRSSRRNSVVSDLQTKSLRLDFRILPPNIAEHMKHYVQVLFSSKFRLIIFRTPNRFDINLKGYMQECLLQLPLFTLI